MKTVYHVFRGASTSTVGTYYFPPQYGWATHNGSGDTDPNEMCAVIPTGGCDLVELGFVFGLGPLASDETIDVTVMKSTDNGATWAATSATIGIDSTSTTLVLERWTGTAISFAAGDLISVQVIHVAPTTTRQDRSFCSLVLDTGATGGQILFGGNLQNVGATATGDAALDSQRWSTNRYYSWRPSLTGVLTNFRGTAPATVFDGDWSLDIRMSKARSITYDAVVATDVLVLTPSQVTDSDDVTEIRINGDDITRAYYWQVTEDAAETVGLHLRTSCVFFPDRVGVSSHLMTKGNNLDNRYLPLSSGQDSGSSSEIQQRGCAVGEGGWREIGWFGAYPRTVPGTDPHSGIYNIRVDLATVATDTLTEADNWAQGGFWSTGVVIDPTTDLSVGLQFDATNMASAFNNMWMWCHEIDLDVAVVPGGANTLADNIKNQWEMDETTGTRVDEQGDQDLTVVSGFGDPGYVADGVLGNAATFDIAASPSEVLTTGVDDDDYNNPASGEVAFAGFVRWNARPTAKSYLVAMAESSGSGHSYALETVATSGQLKWRVVNADADAIFASITFKADVWYFVEMSIIEGGEVVLWVNRTWKSVANLATTINLRTGRGVLFGGNTGTPVPLDGDLDHWACWTVVASDDDMFEACNALDGLAFASWSAGAGGHTATAATTSGGSAGSATSTHVPPSFTATAGADAGGAASSVTSTFVSPTFTATGTGASGGPQGAASAFTGVPTFTASIAGISGGSVGAASATHVQPTFTATAVSTTAGPATALITATSAAPTFTATVASLSAGAGAILAAGEGQSRVLNPTFRDDSQRRWYDDSRRRATDDSQRRMWDEA